MSTVRTILKNILSLSAAQVVTKLITLVVVAYTARTLGAEQYGRWSFATIFASYFSLLATLGVDAIAARHLARERDRLSDLVAQVVPVRFLGSLAGFVALALVIWALPKPTEIKWLTLLCYLPLSLAFWNLMWVFIGLERLDLVALSQLIEQVVNAAMIFLLVRAPGDVMGVPVAGAIGVVAGAGCLLVLYLRRTQRAGHGAFHRTRAVALVREALPFAGTQVLGQMYYNFDSVILSFLRTDAEVGWYNAAYKLVLVVVSFRYTVIFGLNPTFARLAAQSPEDMPRLARRVLQLTALAAVPLGVGGTLLAAPIVRAVFGEGYGPAASALQVLVWSPVALLITLIDAVVLTAAGHWRRMLQITATIVAVNIAANLLMVPVWGIVGAAWATVLADGVAVFLYHRATRNILVLPLGRMAGKPLIAAALMGLVVWPLRDCNVMWTIPVGAAVYGLCALGLGAVDWRDLRALLRRADRQS